MATVADVVGELLKQIAKASAIPKVVMGIDDLLIRSQRGLPNLGEPVRPRRRVR